MTRFRTLVAASAVLLAASAYLDFVYAPEDAVQGAPQRLFYLHVPPVIAAYICFAIVLVGGIVYLRTGSPAADRLARAAAQVGLVMVSVTLAVGLVYAKAEWNWDPSQTWDARFTSTVMLWAVYAGYLAVRRFATPGRQAARFAAVVGIVGFVDVPVVHLSVQWWRTLHPGPVVESGALPREMLVAFLASLVAVLALAGALVWARYRIEAAEDRLLELESSAPQRVGARARLGGR